MDISGEIDWENIKIPKYASVDVRYSINKSNVTDRLNDAWNGDCDYEGYGVRIWQEPFKICEVTDFLFDDDFVEDIAKNFEEITLKEKRTDLYKLSQSDDLANVDDPEAETLLKCLKGQCRTWIQEVTGLELTEEVRATFSRYDRSDFLLCHDDRCEDRKIAFVLYCNKIWEMGDGGSLDLYDTDAEGLPNKIQRSIIPEYNKFIFFEVSNKSYHRVSEIVTSARSRVSINGWFHSGIVPVGPEPVRSIDPLMSNFCPVADMTDAEFNSMVQIRYHDTELQRTIKQHFTEQSEVLLFEFLEFNFMESILRQLNAAAEWKVAGPPNQRFYKYLDLDEQLYPRLGKLKTLLRSKPMFRLLSNLTGLDFETEDESAMSMCSAQIAKWSPGCYTLISDADKITQDYVLDLMIFIDAEFILGERNGGSVIYVDGEDGEELLTVPPTNNSLALVYRDKKTNKFVQYLSLLTYSKAYFILFATYTE